MGGPANGCTHAYHKSAAAALAARRKCQHDDSPARCRVRNCKATPGSLEWHTFCETEVRLTLDAVAATSRPLSSPVIPKGLDVDKIPPAERGELFGDES